MRSHVTQQTLLVLLGAQTRVATQSRQALEHLLDCLVVRGGFSVDRWAKVKVNWRTVVEEVLRSETLPINYVNASQKHLDLQICTTRQICVLS